MNSDTLTRDEDLRPINVRRRDVAATPGNAWSEVCL
jgi:hypothetical protein